jgi:hypothetical protein
MPKLIQIDVSIQSNTLIVGINGGNVTAEPGDTICWRAGANVETFTLQFYRLAAEPAADPAGAPPAGAAPAAALKARGHIVVASLPRWPFTGKEPANDIVGPTEKFEGTLLPEGKPAVGFKYTVSVGNLSLDPIVIIDRL